MHTMQKMTCLKRCLDAGLIETQGWNLQMVLIGRDNNVHTFLLYFDDRYWVKWRCTPRAFQSSQM